MAVRTPFAAAGGVLAGWHPVDLTALVINEALQRSGLDATAIDHLWVGCDEPVGGQGANLGRAAVVAAGWPETVPASVVESNPTSGLAALLAGGQAIASGRAHHVMVVGVGIGSTVTPGASALNRAYGRPWGDRPGDRYRDDGGLLPPVIVADREAAQQGANRFDCDQWASESLRRRQATEGPNPWIVPVGALPGPKVAVQRGELITADVLRSPSMAGGSTDTGESSGVFDPDGLTTAHSLAPAADGVVAFILSSDGETAVGELHAVELGGGSLLSTAQPAEEALRRCRFGEPVPVPERWDVAEPSASTTMVIGGLLRSYEPSWSSDGTINRDGGTLAVGDAGAAEDLRLVMDAMAASAPGTVGGAIRSAAGSAAACVWRRREPQPGSDRANDLG